MRGIAIVLVPVLVIVPVVVVVVVVVVTISINYSLIGYVLLRKQKDLQNYDKLEMRCQSNVAMPPPQRPCDGSTSKLTIEGRG